MSMTNAAEANLLNLLFLNLDWANIGDAAGLQNSATAGSFYVSLHTADPGEAGSGIGTDLSGAGNLIFKGSLTSSLSISNGIQPQFAAGALTVTVD